MNDRHKKLIASFPQKKIDALLVTSPANISYLVGIPSCDSWLVATPKRMYYITDSRYVNEVKSQLSGVSVVCLKKTRADAVASIVRRQGIRTLGFDPAALSVSTFTGLKKTCGSSVKLVAAASLVERLRAVKDAGELSDIRNGLTIHASAHTYLKKILIPGKTEYEVFAALEHFIRQQRVSFSFDPIIASGPHSAFPHARISQRNIRDNEPVLVDMGVEVNGYKTDLTRMFFLGRIAPLIRDVESIVRESQACAIRMIRPGVKAADVYRAARNYLEKKKLARYFTHALGHGVGRDIHEFPSLSIKEPQVTLTEGMVITVEPGVYIPDTFGIRIEDMVVVTHNGCEVLSGNIN